MPSTQPKTNKRKALGVTIAQVSEALVGTRRPYRRSKVENPVMEMTSTMEMTIKLGKLHGVDFSYPAGRPITAQKDGKTIWVFGTWVEAGAFMVGFSIGSGVKHFTKEG